jgi:hypothetical protein
MKFIKPKIQLNQKIELSVSKLTKMLISYYTEYTGYSENEVVDIFFKNVLEDKEFVDWLNSKRYKKKIDVLLTEEQNNTSDESENDV